MSEHENLLAAIHADPEADLPRLVFADWCEENGDNARAEFIRVQCRLAEVREGAAYWAEPAALLGGHGYDQLARREAALLAQHGATWTAGLPELTEAEYEFGRGFAEGIRADGRAVAAALRAVAAVPAIKRLLVRGTRHAQHGGSLALDGLAVPAELDLSQAEVGDAELTRLAAAGLTGLRHLSLGGNWLFPPVLTDFVGAVAVPNLRGLDLAHCRASDAPDALRASPVLDTLERLDVSGNRLGVPGVVDTLADWAATPRLRRLHLGDNDVSARGVAALCESPLFAGLTHLHLGGNHIGGLGLRELSRRFPPGRLTHLSLRDIGGIDDRAAARLADGSGRLASLTHLDLRENGITPAGRDLLIGSPSLPRLAVLLT